MASLARLITTRIHPFFVKFLSHTQIFVLRTKIPAETDNVDALAYSESRFVFLHYSLQLLNFGKYEIARTTKSACSFVLGHFLNF
jgi:hypothetical protein